MSFEVKECYVLIVVIVDRPLRELVAFRSQEFRLAFLTALLIHVCRACASRPIPSYEGTNPRPKEVRSRW